MANQYPKDLAARVHAVLARTGVRKPKLESLNRLFEVLYFASLKQEESEPVYCRVAFVDRENPDPNPEEIQRDHHWECFPLEMDFPLTVRNLVKLSKAVDPWSSTLAIDVHSNDEVHIWGLIDQSVHHSTYIMQETDDGSQMPGIFQAAIEGIGEIGAYRNHEFLGRLRQDTLLINEFDVLQRGPIYDKLLPAIDAFRKRTRSMAKKHYDAANWDYSAADEWITALSRVLIGIQRYGHGGAVLLSNRSSGLAPRYSLKYPRLRWALDKAFANQILESSFGASMDEKYEFANDNKKTQFEIPVTLYVDNYLATEFLRESRAEVTGCVRFLSSLSRVDGLVWLKHDLSLEGFGVMITANQEPAHVFRAGDTSGVRKTALDVMNLGTRHRSMFRQCARDPQSVGFVVSQDGDVRAVTNVNGDVLMWENIRLQRFRNVKPLSDKATSLLRRRGVESV
jgi:hypothetical protein